MNDIARACYLRWRAMPQQQVLDEMAVLFHLAVKIDDVKRLDAIAEGKHEA